MKKLVFKKVVPTGWENAGIVAIIPHDCTLSVYVNDVQIDVDFDFIREGVYCVADFDVDEAVDETIVTAYVNKRGAKIKRDVILLNRYEFGDGLRHIREELCSDKITIGDKQNGKKIRR